MPPDAIDQGMKALLPLFVVLFAAACGAPIQQETTRDAVAAEVLVRDAWAAPTPAGVDVGAGYLTISNGTGGDDRLLSATSPRAQRVEVHEMSMDGAVMQMRPVAQVEIPAGQDVQLAPGGMHLMFYGVAAPFAEGQEIPIQLNFETAGTIDVSLPVRRAGAASHGAEHSN